MKISTLERNEYSRYLFISHFEREEKNNTFLITGCNGMTGSGIIKWLLLENEKYGTKIRIIASTRNPKKKPDYIEADDPVEFCRFGFEREYIGNRRIDYIIHAASPTGRNDFVDTPSEAFRVIVDGTENILDILREQKCSMVYLSSCEVYGAADSETPITEEYVGAINSLSIRSSYSLGKKAAEYLCYAYAKEFNLDVKIIRISAIQGLFQAYNALRVENELLRCVLEKRNLIMKSDGLSKKSFIFSLDAINAVLFTLFYGKTGEAYNATNTDTYLSINDLAETVFNAFSPELHIEYQREREIKTGYLPHLAYTQDTHKLRDLGWKPLTGLHDIFEIDIKRFQS